MEPVLSYQIYIVEMINKQNENEAGLVGFLSHYLRIASNSGFKCAGEIWIGV